MADQKLKIAVLFGGMSSEHDISCISASSILSNINQDKYDVVKIGITKDGRWFLTRALPREVADGSWEHLESNVPAYICPDTSVHGIKADDGRQIYIDCVIPVLHGKYGEDGTMQGLLELAGIPYVGPGVLASSTSMDKTVTKVLVEKTGVRQADYFITDRFTFAQNPEQEFQSIKGHFKDNYPLFVKPANAGSSVGITMAHDEKELFEGLKLAFEHDHRVLVEETIVGREVEVAVLGNRAPHASPVGEIKAAGEFYDFESKYDNAESIAEVATDISEEEESDLKNAAVLIYKTLNCRGLSRVDFFLTDEGVVFNEINTIPGFTEISMYPKLWQAADIGYSELIDRLITLAMEEE